MRRRGSPGVPLPTYHPPPLPLHGYHPHPPHTPIHHSVAFLSIFLVLVGIFFSLHRLESDMNSNTITLMSNTSFAPDIDINLNTTSGSDSSADTSSSVSINSTFPAFVYENGTVVNVIPVFPGNGWPIVGGGFIGRSIQEKVVDMLEGFTNIVGNVDFE